MLKNGRPYHMPQVSAPYTEVINQLDDEDVEYKMVDIDSNELIPTQSFVFADEVTKCNVDNEKPIWINKENKIADGHHRYSKTIMGINPKLRAIKVNMEFKDLCRLLNKIQDIYDFSKQTDLEETTANEYINDYNEIDSDQTENDVKLPLNDFLNKIEEDNNIEVGEEEVIIGYRKNPINSKSVVGNFFYLKPVAGYIKYEISFSNLLDTNNLGINYKDSQNPIDVLAKNWFPHINFKSLSEKYNTTEEKLKNKTIAEKAKLLGFDGIKYGDSYLQGI